ncbi:MAG: hypothetical protein K0S61_225 [Anaerocolumna sp.]|nr:hypothetical protein [Anaerocolumna sp.]
MDNKNVKISVDTLEELLTNNEEEMIQVIRQALITIRDTEGHDNDPEADKKLKGGLLNGEKFNMFRPSCFGKISYGHLSKVLKRYGYQVSQKGNCISEEKTANITFERLQELEDIERKYIGKSDNQGENIMDSKKNTQEILAMSFVIKDFKAQKMMSIRCSTDCQRRLNNLVEKYPCFTKQFLLSLCLDMALEMLGE